MNASNNDADNAMITTIGIPRINFPIKSDIIKRGEKAANVVNIVTVTGVEMAPDLKRASVAVSFLPGVENREEILESLNRARSYLKRTMGRQLRLKYTPDLVFEIDRESDRQARIEELLDRIHDENAQG